ncbi:unnamed protein product [Arctia plantaginis]|uniref:Uncharacterized protein n=1 Tax=Arctia plantaginis TaxID=874455 RepID=A0A8S1BI08_ARCPL|nr:unnamed protein product [Arctia plantaginis]
MVARAHVASAAAPSAWGAAAAAARARRTCPSAPHARAHRCVSAQLLQRERAVTSRRLLHASAGDDSRV